MCRLVVSGLVRVVSHFLVSQVKNLRVSPDPVELLFRKVLIGRCFFEGQLLGKHWNEENLLGLYAVDAEGSPSFDCLAVRHDVEEGEHFVVVLPLGGYPIAKLKGAFLSLNPIVGAFHDANRGPLQRIFMCVAI